MQTAVQDWCISIVMETLSIAVSVHCRSYHYLCYEGVNHWCRLQYVMCMIGVGTLSMAVSVHYRSYHFLYCKGVSHWCSHWCGHGA